MLGLFSQQKRPWELTWRSSGWFVTFVVGYGVMTDLMVYSVIIPVVPFQLEKLGYRSASALTGWLLFAYSVALVTASPICSWYSEKYKTRRSPMLWGLTSLIGFLIMFMEAPSFPVMVLARFIQGISSSVIWVIGLALLVDTVSEERVGTQLGLAMSGLTIGTLCAPPVGGVLYDHLGFRAPFIFGIIIAAFDFVGRLLVIERKDALRWGFDPALLIQAKSTEERTNESTSTETAAAPSSKAEGQEASEVLPSPGIGIPHKLPEYRVWKFMLTSRRTVVALFSIFVYGVVVVGLEPTLALRLQDLYEFDSTKVGLVILASAVVSVFASPISGWISDRFGVEWIIFACLTTTIPWYALLMLKSHLAFFIVCFAVSNFMMAAVVSPLTSELSSIVRRVDGVGFGHIYGFFNMAYGVGSAVGPIVAGQVYSHVESGWTVLVSYGSGLLLLISILNFFFGGERPPASRHRKAAGLSPRTLQP